MRLIAVSPSQWDVARAPILTFIRRYGEDRITHRTRRWLGKLSSTGLQIKGTYIAAMFNRRTLIGVLAIQQHGRRHACVVVHPRFRRQGVGEQLLQAALQQLDFLYARVAIDNIASLRLCFSCGLLAYKMTRGITQKSTLHFIGGKAIPSLDKIMLDP
ncbi:GNAT family N-acetyltransferase [Pasteuria penetrans]|uniref:GNAT family N-acetyltransferase n=1 Tax=Pasteuria penetrans TaxID=86005 RepID=UPI000F9821BB|nr:GNAT family N-acetyltransferase [Pasteuria penetrans]